MADQFFLWYYEKDILFRSYLDKSLQLYQTIDAKAAVIFYLEETQNS